MITYFNIENGTCLLKREDTATKLSFTVLDRSGQWRDGSSLGVRYTVTGDESGAVRINAKEAKKLATRLGGSL